VPFYLLVLLYDYLGELSSIFKNIDESWCLLIGILGGWAWLKKRSLVSIYRFEKYILILYLLLLTIGFLGNVLHTELNIFSLYDSIVFSKVFIVYFGARIYMQTKPHFFEKFDICPKSIELSFYVIFVLAVFNLFYVNLYPISQYRFSLPAIELFFGHPSRLAFAAMVYMLIFFVSRNKRRVYLVLGALFMGLFSLRYKFFAFAFLALASFVYINISSFVFLYIFTFFVILTYTFYPWIFSLESYEFNQLIVRHIVFYSGIALANHYFPIGAGFAKYASYFSQVNYSDVYYFLGLNKVHGLSQAHGNFISDNYLAMIVGQFGYLGSAFYMIIIYLFVFNFNRLRKLHAKSDLAKYFTASIVLVVYTFLESYADSTLSQNRGVFLFYFFAISVTQVNEMYKEKSFQEESTE